MKLPNNSNMPGLLITLEGGEGAGKSSLLGHIKQYLTSRAPNKEIVYTREPGSSSIGDAIRKLILSNDGTEIDAKTEALLFAADRAQHMAEKISPALDRGAIVVCDRFIDSSYAYQSVGRGLGEFIVELSAWAVSGRDPDLTIILDIDPKIGIERKYAQAELNRMEEESIEFHYKVREAFLSLANKGNDRFYVINGEMPTDDVARLAEARLEQLLTSRAISF
jgi:dTMP kinase